MIVAMKKLKDNPLMQIFVLLGLIAAIVLFLFIDSNSFAPKRLTKRSETLSSLKIPRQLENVSILFFSDLEYGTFVDEERLDDLCNAINNNAPDIVIFGGDLYDNEAAADEESAAILKEALGNIEAPLGKFAVLGDNDHRNDEMLASVSSILTSSGFEILNNRSILLHNRDTASITLVGLDNGLNGMQDIEAAYSNVSPSSYVITVCHTPDSASKVPGDITDYFLSGHSHGGQVYYIFGASYTPAMATEYLRGKHSISEDFTLDITNGVGTTGKDARFLAYAEFVVYRLHSDVPPPTPTPTPIPEITEEPQPQETEPVPEEQPAEEVQPEEPVYEEPAEELPEEPAEETYSEEETYEEGSSEESSEEYSEEEYSEDNG